MMVLLSYPQGRWSFDVPRELLPGGAKPGDVLEVSFVYDRRETERIADENWRLMDELLGRDE
jgi:hypothetical protein